MFYDPESLSPDPLYRHTGANASGGGTSLVLYPWACPRVSASTPAVRAWVRRLSPHVDPGPLRLPADSAGRCDLLLDFGTELEAELELSVKGGDGSIFVSFGESIPEAETWGLPTDHPQQTVEWRLVDAASTHRRFPARGFRFVRIQAHDARRALVIERCSAHAWFAFRRRDGDFQCSDPRYQRAWQTALYTARLCARPNTYWDGIKRDRIGWFGDARIIQEITDAAFVDPRPARGMLAELPVDRWVTGIPGYTFDAVAMFRQLLLFHGFGGGGERKIWKQIKACLDWVIRTQLNEQGFVIRDPQASFFADIAFVDWSRMPMGGAFEELSCLQLKWLEALRLAAQIAGWMRDTAARTLYTRRADALACALRETFWVRGQGYRHTLNRTTRQWMHVQTLPLGGDNPFKAALRRRPIGPSGPSRHSMALAGWAGMLRTPEDRQLALRVFNNPRIPRLVTAYFLYYEQCIRAECGQSAEALAAMRDFVVEQIEENDSATLWEWHEPGLQGIRKYYMGDWPKSLCHGWSGGLVPMTLRYLAGIRPVAPGFASLRVDTPAPLQMAFELEQPTPCGLIRITKENPDAPLEYSIPKDITVTFAADKALTKNVMRK